MQLLSSPHLLNLIKLNDAKVIIQKSKCIKLLESPIPAPPPPAADAPAAPSQKASSDNILGTKRGTIDPLVSKRPEKILNKKIIRRRRKI